MISGSVIMVFKHLLFFVTFLPTFKLSITFSNLVSLLLLLKTVQIIFIAVLTIEKIIVPNYNIFSNGGGAELISRFRG